MLHSKERHRFLIALAFAVARVQVVCGWTIEDLLADGLGPALGQGNAEPTLEDRVHEAFERQSESGLDSDVHDAFERQPTGFALSRPVLVASAPSFPGNGFAFGRPLVVHAGPLVDVDFGQDGFSDFPFQDIFARASPFEEMQRDFSELLDSRLQQSHQSNAFQVEEKGGHFKMRTSLPGYKMHKKGETGDEGDQPLSVEVIGRSLVVHGKKTNGRMVQSFQRSFRLPRNADADKIQVTYNNTDGALAVDVPAKASAPEEDQGAQDDGHSWSFDSQDGGSQTTITFSNGGLMDDSSPMLDESKAIQSLLMPFFGGGFLGKPRGHFLGRPAAEAQYLTEAAAKTAPEQSNSKPAVVNPPAKDDLPSKQNAVAPQKEDLPPARPISAPTDAKPLVVQSQNAKPFWRLAGDNGAQMIEIVAPEGAEIGKPDGKQVSVNGKSQEYLELPVSVNNDDCVHAESGTSKEHVLQCKIQSSTVKKLPITVVQEL